MFQKRLRRKAEEITVANLATYFAVCAHSCKAFACCTDLDNTYSECQTIPLMLCKSDACFLSFLFSPLGCLQKYEFFKALECYSFCSTFV